MAQLRTYYDTLQVSRFANEAVIRAAYRTLAQKYHPDKNPDNIESAHRDTKRLNEAYEVLSDPARRAAYDEAVAQREIEINRHKSTNEQWAKRPNNGDAETSGGQESNAEAPGVKAQGSTRYENNTADATRRNFRSTYAPARKAGNLFTAFFVRFKDGLKPKAASSQNVQGNSNLGEAGTLTFWNVIILCLIGGVVLAFGISKNLGSGYDKLGFYSLLFNPGFLGMAIAPTGILAVCAFIGWCIGWTILGTRKHASWVSLLLAVGGFLAVWGGGEIQQQRPVAATGLPETKSSPSQANVVNDPNAQRLYNAALTEIEAQYPVLTPDKPGYRQDLIDQITKKMNEYVAQGVVKHNALRLAVADLERSISQNRPVSTGTQSPSAATVYSSKYDLIGAQPKYSEPYSSPFTAAGGQPIKRELTIEEKVTIGMACNDHQIRGDISGFQSCLRNQTARAQAGGVIPSMEHLTIEEKVTIGMACNDHQIRGDISGFQSCMRTQIGKTVR